MNWYKFAQLESKRRIYVDSDAITFISYNAPSKELTVSFNHGGTYVYLNVPKRVYDNFDKTRSKGEYFNRVIRNRFDYTH